ncbi:MAG: PEP-CTERM sorting domain-containing protein [Bdellovibrionales bacterium]
MSMFKKAAKALLSRPRKAIAAVAATTLLVAGSVLPAFADHYKINYTNGSLDNLLGLDVAEVTLNADLNLDGTSGTSYVSDWNDWSIDVTSTNGSSTNGSSWTINSDNVDLATLDLYDCVTLDSGVVTGGNIVLKTADGLRFSLSGSSGSDDLSLYIPSVGFYEASESGTWSGHHCPEPSTMVLVGFGLLGVAALGRKGFGPTSHETPEEAQARASMQLQRMHVAAKKKEARAARKSTPQSTRQPDSKGARSWIAKKMNWMRGRGSEYKPAA